MGDEPGKREGLVGAKSGLEQRFHLAMALYAVLAALVWFTMDEGKVLVQGRPMDIRLLPLIVIGGLALRTVIAHQAEKIRRDGEKGDGSRPGSL